MDVVIVCCKVKILVGKCVDELAELNSLDKIYTIIFKPGTQCAWFLEIDLAPTSVCVCVCVSALEGLNNQWRDIGRVQLVKQVSRPFPAFNYFI